ncbi:MAG TPA: glycosyltransferase 87 family protein, partial [Streptosporangiaceae bacterium]
MTYRARHPLTATADPAAMTASVTPVPAASRDRLGVAALAIGGAMFVLAMARLGLHLAYPSFLARMFDLGIYRDGGLIVRHAYHFRSGHPTPLYDWVSPGGGNPFTYPPFAAGIFAVVSYLPLRLLQWGMTAASIAALVLAIWLTLTAVGAHAGNGRFRAGITLAVSALALWSKPVQSNLSLGQINLLLMVAIIWDLRPVASRSGHWWTGAVTGVAAGVKLTPLIFVIYLIVTRRFRQAAVALAAFAATVAAGYLALPGASSTYWSTGLLDRANGTHKINVEFFFASAWNQSLRGTLSRIMLHAQLAAGPWLILALVTALTGLLCATWLHSDGYPMLGVLTCALTGLLISPVSWLHHWVWVGPWLAAMTGMAITSRGTARRPVARWSAARWPVARWLWLGAAALVALTFVDWPLVPFLSSGKRGLDVVAQVPMKHPLSWHGAQLIEGNIFVVVGVAGLLALFAWSVARTFQPVRAEGSGQAASPDHQAISHGETKPEVMTFR